jgi:proline racemase
LLGWEFEDLPAPEGSYTMCRLRGRDVAGIHRHAEEEGTGWSSNVSVGDLDRATARTRELGAEVDRSPCGSGSAARVAVLDARGDLGPGQTLVHDSIVGSTFRCRVVDSLTADGHRP